MLKVYNTLTKKVEVFESSEAGVVRAYFCGPTPYDHLHLGHARAFVSFDFLRRYLILKGYNVFYVQNITDIDDKIIRKARELGIEWRDVAEKYISEYLTLLRELRIEVDVHPRVTEHIEDIVRFIEVLIDRGHAYIAPSGSVYFDISTYRDYGRLSGRVSTEEWRQEEEFLSEKKNPFDFALWKAAKPGEPYWRSPWGPGRPGWHIECSVMSSKYLGKAIDIHGGGQDLIFPHHENERAQSESYFNSSPWVRFWIHIGPLTVVGEKMSKSLGNIIRLADAIKAWGSEVIRLWIFSSHYRRPLDYKDESLEQASAVFKKILNTRSMLVKMLRERPVEYVLDEKKVKTWVAISQVWQEFIESMDSDLNSPRALASLHKLLTIANAEVATSESSSLAFKALTTLELIDRVIGVLPPREEVFYTSDELEDLVKLIVEVRSKLRAKKMYEESDWIRAELGRLGIKLADTKDGTTWTIEKRLRSAE
ncbi:MAG: cysteine--tRNA ligase [Sulfolobales archaeon]|nr:cysteine--tRNA ligase [Sulfolobales archaeon]MDW8082408.1 cysteine--tRNA ligase [Sulfolobales archaeon]